MQQTFIISGNTCYAILFMCCIGRHRIITTMFLKILYMV